MTADSIRLDGTSENSMIHYLKALGILKILNEQVDADATGMWIDKRFVINSDVVGEESLVDFFADSYTPTPIVSPWNRGSGFYNTGRGNLQKIKNTTEPRLEKYRQVIKQSEDKLNEIFGSQDPSMRAEELKGERNGVSIKRMLVVELHNSLPDEVIHWIDSAVMARSDSSTLEMAPILVSGGNDGKFECSNNYMRAVVECVSTTEREVRKKMMRDALFGEEFAYDTKIESVGHLHPGAYQDQSSSASGEKFVRTKPWDLMLAMEGITLMAGSVSKRSTKRGGKAAFPFSVEASWGGYSTASGTEAVLNGKKELNDEVWLPIWDNPATIHDVRMLFRNGLAEMGSTTPNNGVEFGIAVLNLGREIGVSAFQRFSILKRRGKDHFSCHVGKIFVTNDQRTELLLDLYGWIADIRLRRKLPPSVVGRLDRLDDAIFDFCSRPHKETLQKVLIAVGKLELQIGRSRLHKSLKCVEPIKMISCGWIKECEPGTSSPEFRIALALASIQEPFESAPNKSCLMRENVEDVKNEGGPGPRWRDERRAAIGRGDLINDMMAILHRRHVDGSIAGNNHVPLSSKICATTNDIRLFLGGHLDCDLIRDLMIPLTFVDYSGVDAGIIHEQYDWTCTEPLPAAYTIIKSNFLPAENYSETSACGIKPVVFKPSIISTLKAGQVEKACDTARQRLRAAGYDIDNPMRDSYYGHAPVEAQRLLASMLIPIQPHEIKRSLERFVKMKDHR